VALRGGLRLGRRQRPPEREAPPEPFYRRLSSPIGEPDPAFLELGFLKPVVDPERRSAAPDMFAPINFAFRLRSLPGIGARSEAVRVLLGGHAHLSVAAITESTAYAKRNVQEALAGMRAAGVIATTTLGNEQRIAIPLDRWLGLLDLEQLPEHVEWPQIFTALRLLLRWLADPANEKLTEYMLSSEARLLLEASAQSREPIKSKAPEAWLARAPKRLAKDYPVLRSGLSSER
jgi:hypothetical protein